MELLDSNRDISMCCPSCHWGITVRENISLWLYAYRAFGWLCDTSWSNSLVWWQFTGRLNKKPAWGPWGTSSLSLESVASYRIAWAGPTWKINLLPPQRELAHPLCLRASVHTPIISCPLLSHCPLLPFFISLVVSPCMLSAQPVLFRSIAEPALGIFASKTTAVCFMLNADNYL